MRRLETIILATVAVVCLATAIALTPSAAASGFAKRHVWWGARYVWVWGSCTAITTVGVQQLADPSRPLDIAVICSENGWHWVLPYRQEGSR